MVTNEIAEAIPIEVAGNDRVAEARREGDAGPKEDGEPGRCDRPR
jgi:hypothetical protein